MSYLSSIGVRYLFGAMLCMASIAMANETASDQIATETTENNDQPPRYLPAGSGCNPTAAREYLKVQEIRACECESGKGEDKKKERPSKDQRSLVACLNHDGDAEEACKDCEALPNLPVDACKDCGTLPIAAGLNTYKFYTQAYTYIKYITTHPGAVHSILLPGLLPGGSIQLEDFSTWVINAGDTYKVLNWLPSDQIVIRGIWYSSQFILENVTTGVEVQASLLQYLHPAYHTYANHRIIAKDSFLDLVWLDDGTVWKIYTFDFMSSWEIGDTIIMGINDDWLTESNYPNILINARLLQYIRATTTY